MRLKPACIFKDRMVFQRREKIAVFGTANPGALVEVTLLKETAPYRDEVVAKTRTACMNGKFLAWLPPQEAGVGLRLIIRTTDEICRFSDICIGEVFLAGGQSNMEFTLNQAVCGVQLLRERAEKEQKRTDELTGLQCQNPIHYYRMPRNVYKDAKYERDLNYTVWESCADADAVEWSAVAFFFAEKLADTLNVPIGIIGCNQGGSSVSCWMSLDAIPFEAEEVYKKPYLDVLNTKTEAEQAEMWQEYMDYQTPWQERIDNAYRENPKLSWDEALAMCGECKWPGPLCNRMPLRPAGLYECLIQPIVPYTIGGVIYYQGENDAEHGDLYKKMLMTLIDFWRHEFRNENLWFHIVQLPGNLYDGCEDDFTWPVIRHAQKRVAQKVPNTSMTCIIDCGERNNIHPVEKRPVGERLATMVLYKQFGIGDEYATHGPLLRTLMRDGDGIYVVFGEQRNELFLKEADGNFRIMDNGESITDFGFEIAGDDKNYYPAVVTKVGKTLRLTSPEVSHPLYARFLWQNYPEVKLFGKTADERYLPAEPFAGTEAI